MLYCNNCSMIDNQKEVVAMEKNEYIDMLRLQKSLEMERFPRYLKNKSNLASFAMVLMSEAVAITQGLPLSFFVNLPVGIVLYGLYMKWKDTSYIVEEMSNITRNSLEYKECAELYDKYLETLADFIRDFGFRNSREAVLYFDAFMNAGVFSQTFNNEYYNFKNDILMTTELLGARVVSGRCVCRHYASFAADLFNKLNILATPLMVKRECELNPEVALRNPRLEMEHAVVGVVDETKKYIYDPTNSLFADEADIEFEDERYRPYVAKPTGDEFDGHYLLYLGTKTFNRKYRESGAIVSGLAMLRLDKEELSELHESVEQTVIKRVDDITGFMLDNKKIVAEIARLEGMISPHSDEPIKKWTLTRNS